MNNYVSKIDIHFKGFLSITFLLIFFLFSNTLLQAGLIVETDEKFLLEGFAGPIPKSVKFFYHDVLKSRYVYEQNLLLVSGGTGTGKTALINSIVNNLKYEIMKNKNRYKNYLGFECIRYSSAKFREKSVDYIIDKIDESLSNGNLVFVVFDNLDPLYEDSEYTQKEMWRIQKIVQNYKIKTQVFFSLCTSYPEVLPRKILYAVREKVELENPSRETRREYIKNCYKWSDVCCVSEIYLLNSKKIINWDKPAYQSIHSKKNNFENFIDLIVDVNDKVFTCTGVKLNTIMEAFATLQDLKEMFNNYTFLLNILEYCESFLKRVQVGAQSDKVIPECILNKILIMTDGLSMRAVQNAIFAFIQVKENNPEASMEIIENSIERSIEWNKKVAIKGLVDNRCKNLVGEQLVLCLDELPDDKYKATILSFTPEKRAVYIELLSVSKAEKIWKTRFKDIAKYFAVEKKLIKNQIIDHKKLKNEVDKIRDTLSFFDRELCLKGKRFLTHLIKKGNCNDDLSRAETGKTDFKDIEETKKISVIKKTHDGIFKAVVKIGFFSVVAAGIAKIGTSVVKSGSNITKAGKKLVFTPYIAVGVVATAAGVAVYKYTTSKANDEKKA